MLRKAKWRWLPRSIGFRLPAGIMLSAAALIALLVYSATTSQKFLKDSIGVSMQLLARELLTRINQELYLRVETIQMQARDAQVLSLLDRSNREFDRLADAEALLARREGEWRAALQTQPTGFMRELTDNPVARSWRDKFIDFHKLKYGYGIIEEIFLTNRHGAIVAQSRVASAYRYDGEPWWQAAWKEGLFLSGSERDRSAGGYGIGICLRVDDREGRFAGVLYARTNINPIISSAAMALSRHETATVRMLTGDGKTIFSTKPFRLLESGEGAAYFRRLTGTEGFLTARRGARQFLVSYAKTGTFNNLKWPSWILVMEHDMREVAMPSIRLNARITVVSLILVAMSLLIAFALSRSIIAPLKLLSRAVKRAGEGDLQQSIPIERDDEVGHLAKAFSAMIQKRREAERELAVEKEFSESIIETANALVVALSHDGSIVSFNRFAERVTGYSRSEVIGKNWCQLFIETPERGELQSLQRRLLSSAASAPRVNAILAKNGDRVPVEWANSVLPARRGGEPITLSIGIDLSERARTESALYEAEAKYRSAMESMTDLVYICSQDFRLEYINRAMIVWLGRDATGERCYAAIHGRPETCPDCPWPRIRSGDSFASELVSPKDGRIFHVTHVPVVHQNGSLSKMTVFRDTTEIKKIESQLRQAQKMESLGTLAGGIAHDFNNILAPILIYSEMLLETAAESSGAREGLSAIHQAALRAKDLVQQILTFSRRRSYELKPVCVQEVLAEALKLARSSLPSTIAIQQEIDPACPPVMADATQIHQIAMNLITNAFQAMEQTGGVLSVSLKQIELGAAVAAHKQLGQGLHVCLTVADTGMGMDQRVLEKLFDPYFTTKQEGKGTGLGLAVAHGIVKSHGGQISVYSERGKGTKFYVYLPVTAPREAAEDHSAAAPLQHGSESILLVDDQQEVLGAERSMLERLGYRVTALGGSAEALEAFRADPDSYDLVLTDLTMPNMTGDRLAAEILCIRSQMPIVLCTGFSESLHRDALASLGVRECLMKPVSLGELSMKIRKVLDEAGADPRRRHLE